ncbi:motility protein A [Microbacterium sp. GXF7504]
MDIALILGMVLAFGALLGMISLEGASVTALLLPAPMLLVFFGTIAVGIASGTIRDAKNAVAALPRAFRGDKRTPASMIDSVVGYAERARSEGLLALESGLDSEDDPFVRKALQNIADGMDPEELRVVMEDEIGSAAARNRATSKFYSTLGGYAPTVGIIGTVVSLTHVLEKLDEPSELGPMIAAAFVATLWGLLSANFIWLPIGNRLQRLGELELERMNLVMEGMLAVQSGASPHHVSDRLQALVSTPAGGRRKAKPKADEAGEDEPSLEEALLP